MKLLGIIDFILIFVCPTVWLNYTPDSAMCSLMLQNSISETQLCAFKSLFSPPQSFGQQKYNLKRISGGSWSFFIENQVSAEHIWCTALSSQPMKRCCMPKSTNFYNPIFIGEKRHLSTLRHVELNKRLLTL